MALTDTAIRNPKPTDKPVGLTDEGGLYLLLNTTGSKWWRVDYRFAGKRKTLSMGVYPDVGLKDSDEDWSGQAGVLGVAASVSREM